MEFSIMNSILHLSYRKSARCLRHLTHVTLYYITIYIYICIYKLYILYQIVLRVGNSRTNECSWPLADLPLIIAYVQDVLEVHAGVENGNLYCICKHISRAQRRVRVYFHCIPWDTLYVLTLPSKSKGTRVFLLTYI